MDKKANEPCTAAMGMIRRGGGGELPEDLVLELCSSLIFKRSNRNMESPDDPAVRNSQVLLRAPPAVMATSGLGVSAQGEYAEDLELLRGREESRRGDACIKVVR